MLLPIADTGLHTASRFALGWCDLDHFVDDDPLFFLHHWGIKHIGQAEGFGLHRVVNGLELKGNIDVTLYMGQLAKGIERGVGDVCGIASGIFSAALFSGK